MNTYIFENEQEHDVRVNYTSDEIMFGVEKS